jgi:MFS family permease
VAISSLLVGLSLGQKGNWDAWETQTFLAIAALSLITFPWFESRRAHPLVDMTLFKNRNFAFNNAARFICFVGLTTTSMLMPFFLQVILGYSPSHSGFLIAPAAMIMAVSAPFAGWLANHISSRILTGVGMSFMGLSLYGMSHLTALSGYSGIVGLLLLQGLGNGIFQTPNNTSIIDSVARERFGIASGILALTRVTARSFGTSLASTIVVGSMYAVAGNVSLYSLKQQGSLTEGGDALLAAFAHGISKAFLVVSLLCILGLIFSVVRSGTERDRGKHARATS